MVDLRALALDQPPLVLLLQQSKLEESTVQAVMEHKTSKTVLAQINKEAITNRIFKVLVQMDLGQMDLGQMDLEPKMVVDQISKVPALPQTHLTGLWDRPEQEVKIKGLQVPQN